MTFMVAQVLRFWPEYEFVKQLNDTGKYGRLLSGDGKTLTVSRTEDEPDLRCTIGGLSALAVSAMGFQECLDARLAALLQPDNRRFMAELFRARKQHLHNYF